MDFISRLQKIIDHVGIQASEMACKCGVSRSQMYRYLDGEQEPKTNFFVLLRENYPDINIEWLILGDGEMLKTNTHSQKWENVHDLPRAVLKHMEIVKNFEDHEAALEINNDLIIIERNCRPLFEKAKTYISGMKDASIVFNDVKKTGQITKQLDGSQERRRKKAV